MLENAFIIELVKVVGFPAILYVVWIITQKSNEKSIQAFLKQSENMTKSIEESYKRMLDMQNSISDKNFSLLQEILEMTRMQTGSISRLETKIDSNQYCPILARRGDYQK